MCFEKFIKDQIYQHESRNILTMFNRKYKHKIIRLIQFLKLNL